MTDILERAYNRACCSSKEDEKLLLEMRDEISRLRSLLKETAAALEVAEETLDNYADVVDGDEGQPRANAAMQAQLEVRSTLWKLKRALPPAQEGE